MIRRLATIALLAVLPLAVQAQSRLAPEAAGTLQDGLTRTADLFVLPAYEALAWAAEDMERALADHCAGTAGIGPARDAYADTFLAWQRASLIGVGPVMEAEGPMRVQLWPDAKDYAARAVRAAVAAGDPALTAPGGLEGRSIALSNLTALEHLLHAGAPPEGYACDLARAIAAFQADLAAGLAAAWTPGSDFRADYDGASRGNARFASVDAVLRGLLSGAVVQVDRLRKFKILRGLGAAPGEARPERTEARIAGLGLASIEASLRGLSDLYAVPGGLFDAASGVGGSMAYLTLAQSAGTLADTLAFRYDTLDGIAAEDGPAAEAIRRLGDEALRHETFLKRFPDAIGVSAGFTSADGD